MIVARTLYGNLSPPRPDPLPRKAEGEGGEIRVPSHLIKTPVLFSFQHFHRPIVRLG